jgi:hypothetical protein
MLASLAFLILVPFAAGLTLDNRLADSILAFQVPRVSLNAIRPGIIELGDLVQNSLGPSRTELARWLPAVIVTAIALSLAVILLAALLRRRPEVARRWQAWATAGLLIIVLTTATFASATPIRT